MFYFIGINVLGLILCVYDKYLAINHKYRISEKTLLFICLLGGVFGFFLGSITVRHKTKDVKFRLFLYPILIIWILISIYFMLQLF